MKIGIASDHRGFSSKEYLLSNLDGFDIIDYGTNSDEAVDFPIYAKKHLKQFYLFQVLFHYKINLWFRGNTNFRFLFFVNLNDPQSWQ